MKKNNLAENDGGTLIDPNSQSELKNLQFFENVNSQGIPEKVGKYKVIGTLGQGASATVLKGIHEDLGREVAIKILHSQFQFDPIIRQRFEDEAKTIAGIRHPNILEVYDYGHDKTGNTFMVTQLIEGAPLSQWKLKGVVSKLLISLKVLQALKHLHSLNIIHRDIKSENILCSLKGEVILSDFGLAKSVSENKNLTMAGNILGTIYYLAPEILKGKETGDDTYTSASDVFAFGVMVYHQLTGKFPFDGESFGEVCKNIEKGSYVRADLINQEINTFLSNIIDRCLEYNPRKRYERVEFLIRDFISYFTQQGISEESYDEYVKKILSNSTFGIHAKQPFLASLIFFKKKLIKFIKQKIKLGKKGIFLLFLMVAPVLGVLILSGMSIKKTIFESHPKNISPRTISSEISKKEILNEKRKVYLSKETAQLDDPRAVEYLKLRNKEEEQDSDGVDLGVFGSRGKKINKPRSHKTSKKTLPQSEKEFSKTSLLGKKNGKVVKTLSHGMTIFDLPKKENVFDYVEKPYVLQGKISEFRTLAPIPNALISMTQKGLRFVGVSDGDGNYKMDVPIAGIYTLKVDKIGFKGVTEQLEMFPDEFKYKLGISLEKNSPLIESADPSPQNPETEAPEPQEPEVTNEEEVPNSEIVPELDTGTPVDTSTQEEVSERAPQTEEPPISNQNLVQINILDPNGDLLPDRTVLNLKLPNGDQKSYSGSSFGAELLPDTDYELEVITNRHIIRTFTLSKSSSLRSISRSVNWFSFKMVAADTKEELTSVTMTISLDGKNVWDTTGVYDHIFLNGLKIYKITLTKPGYHDFTSDSFKPDMHADIQYFELRKK